MDFQQLRYFLAAADTGAISRAATRCGVSQPAVSAQLGRLEEELGVRLFDRLGRGVALTEAGRALLPRARRICGQVEEIESSLRADLESGRGRVAIGAIPTMAPHLVPPLVAALRAEYPECEVIVREDLTENLVEALVDNELDVAIMSAPVEHDLIELEVVGREPLLVVTPADHPLAKAAAQGAAGAAGEVALADLRDLPAVTLHEMHCLGRTINEFCQARRLASNVVCRSTQIDTLLEFVRLGLGVSIVPQMVAERDSSAETGRRYLRFKSHPPTRAIALAWRRGRSRSTLARRLGDLLRRRLAAEPTTDGGRDARPDVPAPRA